MVSISPKKSLGQHFLNSKNVLTKILTVANVQKGETVLEIGPGTGILTAALIATKANIYAIEKDVRACELLTEKFKAEITSGQLQLVQGDILDQKINEFPNFPKSDSQFAVVANIPYYITGAILEKFLANTPRPNCMILLVQKEVADRIICDKESILSVSVKAFGTPKLIATVPRGAFTPPPSVDSAILQISDISDRQFRENNVQISRFFSIVRAGFAHKRKYAVRNLEAVIDPEKIKNIWTDLHLDPKIRAEDIPIHIWFQLSREQ